MMMTRSRNAKFIYKTEISTGVIIELINKVMGDEYQIHFCLFS